MQGERGERIVGGRGVIDREVIDRAEVAAAQRVGEIHAARDSRDRYGGGVAHALDQGRRGIGAEILAALPQRVVTGRAADDRLRGGLLAPDKAWGAVHHVDRAREQIALVAGEHGVGVAIAVGADRGARQVVVQGEPEIVGAGGQGDGAGVESDRRGERIADGGERLPGKHQGHAATAAGEGEQIARAAGQRQVAGGAGGAVVVHATRVADVGVGGGAGPGGVVDHHRGGGGKGQERGGEEGELGVHGVVWGCCWGWLEQGRSGARPTERERGAG